MIHAPPPPPPPPPGTHPHLRAIRSTAAGAVQPSGCLHARWPRRQHRHWRFHLNFFRVGFFLSLFVSFRGWERKLKLNKMREESEGAPVNTVSHDSCG